MVKPTWPLPLKFGSTKAAHKVQYFWFCLLNNTLFFYFMIKPSWYFTLKLQFTKAAYMVCVESEQHILAVSEIIHSNFICTLKPALSPPLKPQPNKNAYVLCSESVQYFWLLTLK